MELLVKRNMQSSRFRQLSSVIMMQPRLEGVPPPQITTTSRSPLYLRCNSLSTIQTLIPDPKWRHIKQRHRVVAARKPRWLPPAPSKLFRIPVKNDCPPEEQKELIRLTRIYKTEIKSISNYWVQEYVRKTAGSDMEQRRREEDEEHRMLMEINREENERVAKLREERVRREFQEEEERLLNAEQAAKEARKRVELEVDEIVRREKQISATYITREKLEQAINEALDNPITYNYAIDLAGNQHWEEAHPKFDEKRRVSYFEILKT